MDDDKTQKTISFRPGQSSSKDGRKLSMSASSPAGPSIGKAVNPRELDGLRSKRSPNIFGGTSSTEKHPKSKEDVSASDSPAQDIAANMRQINPKQAPCKNVYIAIMGLTGSGKSTFISHLVGPAAQVEIGHSLNSCKVFSPK